MGYKKITEQEFINKIPDNILLLSNYKNSKTKIRIQCKICNHIWETFPYVLYRSGCPQCANQIKHTIISIKKELKIINPDLEIIDTIYINNKTPLKIKCKKCGYEFKSKSSKLLSQTNPTVCQKCSSRKIKTHDQYILKYNPSHLILLSKYVDYKTHIKVKCKECSHVFDILPSNLNRGCGCPKCNKFTSKPEQEIEDWIKTLGITNIKRNKMFYEDGTKRELDIYLPDYNLGIDYNGLYFHSDIFQVKNYHQHKYLFFEKLNIQIIQVFENDWLYKPVIVKSIIKNKLGLNNVTYGRQCEVQNIDTKTAKQFLEKNHINGFKGGAIKLGLYKDNELLSVCIIGKARFNKKYKYELIRSATKIGLNVVGGFNKLIKYFKKNFEGEIISYVDLRYFSGKGYKLFDYKGITKPNYWYFKSKERILYNRINFQKHKLKSKLKIFNEDKTEYENMIDNGYLKIYDCGQKIFTL